MKIKQNPETESYLRRYRTDLELVTNRTLKLGTFTYEDTGNFHGESHVCVLHGHTIQEETGDKKNNKYTFSYLFNLCYEYGNKVTENHHSIGKVSA